jgi:hypothetical protein
MRRALGLCIVCACLAACSPEPQEAPSRTAREAVPEGRWIVAGGAGETALVFVPYGGGKEIALICAMGETPTFRVETGDEAFAAVPDAAAAAILVGDLAIEGGLTRMATEAGDLAQMRTPITETLLAQIRSAERFRLNAGDAFVATGAVPEDERDAFAGQCAALAGFAAP